MQSPEEYEKFKQDSIAKAKELQVKIESATGGKLNVGAEIELMTTDAKRRQIDKAAVFAKLSERFPEVTEFKVEGPAFCAYKIGVWDSVDQFGLYPNNDGRYFISDRPKETIMQQDVAPRILRWEILTRPDLSADRATQICEEIQPAITEILREMYPGMRVTTRPKVIKDIDGLIDVEAAIENFKNTNDKVSGLPLVPADSTAKTLEDLETMHGIRVVPQIPGMGMQRNYSLEKDGVNMFNGEPGSDEFSDLAWQVLAGLTGVANESVAGFLGTNESYNRSARLERTAAQAADDLTQCKPEKVALMHTDARKFESFPFMVRPYSEKATKSIDAMTNDPARVAAAGGKANYGRKESDIRGGKYDRVEVRVTDCVSDQWLQANMELAGILHGIQSIHTDREQIQKDAALPMNQRRIEDSLSEELGRFAESELIPSLVGIDYHSKAIQHLSHQVRQPARGDDGLKAYCQSGVLARS